MTSLVPLIGPLASRVAPGGGFTPPVTIPLTNPGAEVGDTTGWTSVGLVAKWVPRTDVGSGYPGPKSGSWYFSGGNNNSPAMYQDADVSAYATDIDAGNVKASLAFWIAGFNGYADHMSVFLRALDGANAVISSVSLTELYAPDAAWLYQELGMLLPNGARKIRVEIAANRTEGVDNDCNIDDMALTLLGTSYVIPARYDTAISQGNRTSIITVSATNLATGGGALSGLVDGSEANNYYWTNATGNGTGFIKFDFGVGASWIIDEFIWRQNNAASHGTWRFEGSNDDSNWAAIGVDFTLVPGIIRPGNPSSAAYRYVRLRHMSGARSSSPWLREIRFRARAP